MKLFLALLAIVACVSAEWQPKTADEIKTIRAACLQEVPLTEEQMNQMKSFKFPNEEAVRKYLMCTSVKMDIFCTHMGWHADRIAKQFKMDMEEGDVQKLAEDCLSKHPKGDKANDVYVYEVHSCLMDSEVGQKVKAYVKKRQEQMSHA
ncbi:general odorant-binding protein 99a-like [Musca autumnalis]|uniref:general odorant-binding protein 99a-like n=1 Tax=Musca autumnalis TaxID=221902 RepID=UPI003CF05EFE